VLLVVLHIGVAGVIPHWLLLVHWTHSRVVVLQAGVEPPHWAFDVHCTQEPPTQKGASPPHAALPPHLQTPFVHTFVDAMLHDTPTAPQLLKSLEMFKQLPAPLQAEPLHALFGSVP
jgi:hypothetical protein